MAAAAPAKRLEWAPRALDAYLATLARIAEEVSRLATLRAYGRGVQARSRLPLDPGSTKT